MKSCLKILYALILLHVMPALADYSYEIQQAQRNCAIERKTIDQRGGAPSCEVVRQLLEQQRLETEASVSEKTGQPMPSHINTNIYAPTRVYDQRSRRWCTDYHNGGALSCY